MSNIEYSCPRCHFKSLRKQDFTRHIHRKNICQSVKSNDNLNDLKNQYPLKSVDVSLLTKYSSGLSKHVKLCSFQKKEYLDIQKTQDLLKEVLEEIRSLKETKTVQNYK